MINDDSDLEYESDISYISTSSDENLEHSTNLQLSGSTLRHYNIINELGRGSYSIVWLAYNIKNNNFYAIKVQDPSEFKVGLSEIKFMTKLPKNPNVFNNLIEYFIEKKNNYNFLCSVWNLHYCNVDTLIRKYGYNNGLEYNLVKKIMQQLITAITILHKKIKVFHGDIKTDNILVKGINNYNKNICEKYLKELDNLNNENREIYHKKLTNNILEELNNNDINISSNINQFITNINISLSDFGTFCDESTEYTGTFGTRYYQAPEIILLGKCSYPVDIWALGCTFYELLTGQILFDPIKDSKWSRDYYHLCLINDTCGTFPYSFIKKTKKYKDFFISNKLIDYKQSENRLDRKLKDLNLDSSIKDILQNMLTIDPNKRCTIDSLSLYFNQV
jgi:serine/threonine protein kinase